MTDLNWQEPPPDSRRRAQSTVFTDDVREALRANPGKWALIHESHAGTSANWKRRHGPNGFEFTSRYITGTRPKRFTIYARFVGEVSV